MKKAIPIHEIFESRRKFPRLRTNIPAFVDSSGGGRIEALIYDLSPDGAKIRYSKKNALKFLHADTPMSEIKSIKFYLVFKLSFTDHTEVIRIPCRPIYLHSVNEDLYAAGVMFDRKAEKELAIINDYLFYQMEPTIEEFKDFMDMQSRRKLFSGKKTDTTNQKKTPRKQAEIRSSQQQMDNQNTRTAKKTTNSDINLNKGQKKDQSIEHLKQEVMHMQASLKTLEDSNRLMLKSLSRIERKL